MKATLTATVLALGASSAMAADVNPGIIFGSGNDNGSFTVTQTDSNSGYDVEIGLRAKERFPRANVFNWDGVDTYTFNPNDYTNPANRSAFNFEFSVNTDAGDNSNSNVLNDFTYMLTVDRLNADGMTTTELFSFDAITGANPLGDVLWDHSIGDNSTTDATDSIATDVANYASLLSNNNVAQQSWNLGFFTADRPNAAGTYFISLTAFVGMTEVASTDITVNVVPVPTAAFAGLGLLGSLAGFRAIRRR